MDVTILNEFINELTEVEEYMKYIEHTDTNLATIFSLSQQLTLHHQDFRVTKRLFEYKAIIISLYGLLEKYIENWIKEYLDNLTRLVNYDKIDESIRNNHFEHSLVLIQGLQKNKFQYLNLNKSDLLKNLYECESRIKPYKFNSDAFILASSGNLTHGKIASIFNSFGIQLDQKLRKVDKFVDYLRELNEEKIEILESGKLYEIINNLVDRRNEISHGGEIVDILDKQFLKDYTKFLKNYCEAIFEVLKIDLILKEKEHQFEQLSVIKVYPREKVLEIYDRRDDAIKIGDFIIIEIGQEEKILKIKILDKRQQETDNQPTVTIAVDLPDDVSVKLKKTYKYYIKRSVNKNINLLPKRRIPPVSIAGKGKTLGDLVSPIIDEEDWECLK